MTDRAGVWGFLERWRSLAFLAAGVPFLAIAINDVLIAVANTGTNLSPLVPPGLLLFVYTGLLGMSSQLVEDAPRLGRVGQTLVLVFVIEIFLTFTVWMFPEAVPRSAFALTIATAIIGAAVTLTVFAALSLRSQAYSRAVGGFLLLAAVGLYLLIAKVILFGDIGGPEWLAPIYNGVFAVSIIAVGLLLRTTHEPTEKTESSKTVA